MALSSGLWVLMGAQKGKSGWIWAWTFAFVAISLLADRLF
jgi:hypothetical protein